MDGKVDKAGISFVVVGVGAEAAVDVFKEQAEAAVVVGKVEWAREVDKSEADTAVVVAKG